MGSSGERKKERKKEKASSAAVHVSTGIHAQFRPVDVVHQDGVRLAALYHALRYCKRMRRVRGIVPANVVSDINAETEHERAHDPILRRMPACKKSTSTPTRGKDHAYVLFVLSLCQPGVIIRPHTGRKSRHFPRLPSDGRVGALQCTKKLCDIAAHCPSRAVRKCNHLIPCVLRVSCHPVSLIEKQVVQSPQVAANIHVWTYPSHEKSTCRQSRHNGVQKIVYTEVSVCRRWGSKKKERKQEKKNRGKTDQQH